MFMPCEKWPSFVSATANEGKYFAPAIGGARDSPAKKIGLREFEPLKRNTYDFDTATPFASGETAETGCVVVSVRCC